MFNSAKYIVVEFFDGDEVPLIFPNFIEHSSVATRLGFGTVGEVISAGFVEFSTEGKTVAVSAFGGSVSLGCKSRECDAGLIRRALKLDDS